jgi:hypothetical protein
MVILFLVLQPLMRMKVEVDKKEVTVGEPLVYKLEMKFDTTLLKLTPLKVEKIGNFEVISSKVVPSDSGKIFVCSLLIFKTGTDTIQNLKIKCINTQGEDFEFSPPIQVIEVKSVLPRKLKDIKDIVPPLEVPFPLGWVIFYVSLGIVVLASGFLLLRRYILKKKIPPPPSPSLPPHEVAYKKLEELQVREGKIKEFYIELSDIIRRYLEARYKVPAPTSTTLELYRELKAKKIGYMYLDLIRCFFSSCDLVKFAKVIPPLRKIEEDKKLAKEIINKTKTITEEIIPQFSS